MKYYGTSIEPNIGDKVLWAGAPAEVLEVGNQFYYNEDGNPDVKRGVANELLIQFENGSLFQLNAENSPDLKFVTRGKTTN